MTKTEKVSFVSERISTSEILCHLAEESAELAHAALKLRGAFRGDTDLEAEDATNNLLEEIADVITCVNITFAKLKPSKSMVDGWVDEKLFQLAKLAGNQSTARAGRRYFR